MPYYKPLEYASRLLSVVFLEVDFQSLLGSKKVKHHLCFTIDSEELVNEKFQILGMFCCEVPALQV
jgi:hypothetical protein